ncbi:conserved hypothetical protein [Helicobacter cinaedi CCUG 18818 = ATCC BAA-847]|uniref:Uncharacterized protein n=5 Tax=Helicobacter cinaedi TaxID=213 RepID=A0AAI8MJU1_9HELI|nr:hypothetical protein [Helicobacter cinaedi]BAM32822.1 conserved hypothetical protein [Helicobacter cinaedi CCUG 18818 = ATCC BAA-847]
MKYFILIFISLITLVICASCGLIQTSSADKEKVRIAKEYGGIYVFDKAIRDEIIALEKQELIERKKVSLDDPNFVKKMVALEEKYSILSNGCKYYLKGPSKQELKENDWSLYYQKVKEYMGEEIFEKLKKGLAITSYYIDKNGKVIPITMLTYISTTITTYGLYGDEGAGFRFTETRKTGMGGDNIFYLENGRFIKSNEKRKDMK